MVDYTGVKSLTHLNVPSSLTIVGLGGLGVWGAYQAVMLGVEKVSLFDGDIVAAVDLAKVPYEPRHVGSNKAKAAAELLQRLRPSCELIVNEQHFETKHCELIIGSMFNAADDIDVDKFLSSHCEMHKIPYVSGVYGKNAIGVFDHLPQNLKISRSPVPTTSSLCSAAAGLALNSLFSENSYSLLIDFDSDASTVPDIEEGLLSVGEVGK